MTRREKIQETLGGFNISPMRAALITNALLAAIEPDEAGLRKIFEQHDKKYPTAHMWKEALIRHILSWHRGEPEKPREWCPHIRWLTPDPDIGSKFEGYVFYGERSTLEPINSANDATNWTQCPLNGCGAKRPG